LIAHSTHYKRQLAPIYEAAVARRRPQRDIRAPKATLIHWPDKSVRPPILV